MTADFNEFLSERLQDPEVAAAYLNEFLEEGDEAGILTALEDIAESRKHGARGSAVYYKASKQEPLSETDRLIIASIAKAVHRLGFKLKAEGRIGT